MGFITYIFLPLAALVALGWLVRTMVGRTFDGPVGALFRAMPLSAAFGLTVIFLYVVGSVFAPVLAPYGESEIFEAINLLPGDDPRFILGTDQLLSLIHI